MMSALSSLLDPRSVLVGVVVALCLLCWMATRRSPGPGPALPLLGHLHLLTRNPRGKFLRWKRRYGDVVSLYLGRQLTVILTSYSAIREALVTFGDVFSDRPADNLMAKLHNHKGIAVTSGQVWQEQRRVALEILRHLGKGRNVLAHRVQGEITHYIRAIRDHQGTPFDLGQLTRVSISNNICFIIFGKRFEYDDADFRKYICDLDRHAKLVAGSAVLDFIPVLGYLPGDLFGRQEARSNVQSIFSFVDRHVQQHRRDMEQGLDTGDDFVFAYLREMDRSPDQGSSLDDGNLRTSIVDLFMGGAKSTASVLAWCLLHFLHNPHVQDECFKQISDVIGTDRPPAVSDREILPYVEATLWEALRIGDVVSLTVPRTASRDVTFRGHDIPKDTYVTTALTCTTQDPEIWGDPENFRPERFLGPDGKLVKADELIPFGIGRRMCLGESLARMELFLYLVSLVQNFRFLPAEEGKPPSLKGLFGLTHVPQPYQIRAVPRK